MPTRRSLSLPQQAAQLDHDLVALMLVDVEDRSQELRVGAVNQGHVLQSPHVLGEAASPEAEPGVEESGGRCACRSPCR